MSALEWLAHGAVLLLLMIALPFAWRLERQIAALRREGAGFEAGAASIGVATAAAEAAMVRLRATTEQAGRGVAERAATAEALRDDLRFLTERAEAIADRLDGLVRDARPAAAPHVPSGPRSEAERDLLRAIQARR